jgi:hypothetical protein
VEHSPAAIEALKAHGWAEHTSRPNSHRGRLINVRIEEPGGPDAETLSPDRPVYQVNIFTKVTDVPEEDNAWSVGEWKVYEAEVSDVLTWAADKAAGRPYTVNVAATDDENTLLRLLGKDPTWTEMDSEPFRLSADGVPDHLS